MLFEERVFPGAMEEVVLLLAEGTGPTDHIEVRQALNLSDLAATDALRWMPNEPAHKWTPALLNARPLATYDDLRESFIDLQAWGETDLGMVTGNNRFFTLTVDEVEQRGLTEQELRRISPPGSAHLRGLTFDTAGWQELAAAGKRVWLFRPDDDEPSDAAKAYIAEGEDSDVQKAYKCRVRDPWWRVPWVAEPDLLLTYMNHDTPRLVTNAARVSYLNSVHGVRVHDELRSLAVELLPVASLNSLTLLGAELVGRSYGGGILKVEPKEADVLPVPTPTALRDAASDLRGLVPNVALLLQRGQLLQAVRLVDQVLLVERMGVKAEQLEALREGHGRMALRRNARGRRPTVSS